MSAWTGHTHADDWKCLPFHTAGVGPLCLSQIDAEGRLNNVSSGSKGDRGGLRESDEVTVTPVGLSWLEPRLTLNTEVVRLGNIGVRKEQTI